MGTQPEPISARNQPPESPVAWVYRFWAWQVLAWALYRYFLHLPEWVDELVAKPLVFVTPVLWYVLTREKRKLSDIGLTIANLPKSLLLGLGVGGAFVIEGIVMNIFKHGSLVITPTPTAAAIGIAPLFILTMATAFTEELLSRGFYFTRIYEGTKRLWYAAFMSTTLFVLFHIPILVTTLRFTGSTLIIFFWTTFIVGFVNSLLYDATKSLVAPLVVHIAWNMVVSLFL